MAFMNFTRRLKPPSLKADRRSVVTLEFALVGPVFLLLLFVVFEIAYGLFQQEILNDALQQAGRQILIGDAQGATSANFVSTYFCPYTNGLLNCDDLYLRIEQVTFAPGSCTNVTQPSVGDYYDATTGFPPVVNNQLQLGGFFNGAGIQGAGSKVGASPCATANSKSGFCNAGPQAMMLLSAVYVAPTFVGALIPGRTTYNGNVVGIRYDTVGFITEPFVSTSQLTPC